MRKKKILFYTSGIGLGGVEKVLLEILGLLDKKKFDIKVALQNENENLFESEIPKEVSYKYMLSQKTINKLEYFKQRRRGNILYRLFYSIMLKKRKKEIKKNYLEFSSDREVVIDFKTGEFLKLINLKNGVNKKRICWLHTDIKTLYKNSKNKEAFKSHLKQCDKIVCICKEMQERASELIKESDEKFKVIYNPFDINRIKRLAEDKSELNEEEIKLLLDNYIIMVSRLDNVQKDFFTLIKAFKIVQENDKNIKLYLLGDGVDRKIIENLIAEENLQEKVKILGIKKNPYLWIKRSKFLVHSSIYEGLPTVLIEGLILNKRIISSNCPTGPTEILEKGKLGDLYDVGDYKSLAKLILKRLKNIDINVELIKKSIKKYDSQNIKEEIEKLFLE